MYWSPSATRAALDVRLKHAAACSGRKDTTSRTSSLGKSKIFLVSRVGSGWSSASEAIVWRMRAVVSAIIRGFGLAIYTSSEIRGSDTDAVGRCKRTLGVQPCITSPSVPCGCRCRFRGREQVRSSDKVELIYTEEGDP